MIQRYAVRGGRGMDDDEKLSVNEHAVVLYSDHVAEMREVLEAGRMLYLHGDSERCGEWLAIIDKYRRYLEER